MNVRIKRLTFGKVRWRDKITFRSIKFATRGTQVCQKRNNGIDIFTVVFGKKLKIYVAQLIGLEVVTDWIQIKTNHIMYS